MASHSTASASPHIVQEKGAAKPRSRVRTQDTASLF